MRNTLFFIVILLLVLCCPCQSCPAETTPSSSLLERYRDFKIYATSEPDAKNPAAVVMTVWMENHEKKALDVAVTLPADAALGMDAVGWRTPLPSAGEAKKTIILKPTGALKREIVQGTISFSGVVDRDLFIAVEGPDRADFKNDNTEKITAKAQVAAAYAPRTLESIRRSMKEKSDAAGKLKTITLAANGKSNYHIEVPFHVGPPGVVSTQETTVEKLRGLANLKPAQVELINAIADLQRCINIQSGASLPLISDKSRQGPGIILSEEVQLSSNDPSANERYRLEVRPTGDLIITSPTLEGLRHGIYGLLTDHLDCHWFLPKKLGEEIIIPADKTVRLPANLDETHTPPWFSVTGMSWGQAHEWDLRNRTIINRGRMSFGHSWANYINKSLFPYDKFPDYYARDKDGKIKIYDNGWSSTNFCSTNPKVIEIVAAKVNAAFKANPDLIVMSLDPNDMAPFCECERCQALDKSYGIEHQDGEHMADRLLHFSKEIDDRLDPAYKEKYLGILAYGHQTNPPVSATAHPHHAALTCDFPSYFDHSRPFNDPTSKWNKIFNGDVTAWGKMLHGKNLGFYDYYGQYNFFGPWGILHKMREDLPAFHDLGGTFLMIEAQPNFAINGLNLYIASRLANDVNADVDELTEEYLVKFHGPAADLMRKFYLGAERWFALERPGKRTQVRVGARDEFWKEMDGYLKEAEKSVTGADQRYIDRVTFVRDGFEYGQGARQLVRMIPRHGPPNHLPEAIKFLQDKRAEVERMKAKYTAESEYWPIMLAPYFYPQFDPMIKAIEKAMQDEDAKQKLGDTLDGM